jgi:hypothetical protein
MSDDDLIKRISNYGCLSYNNGFKDGYLSGIVSGVLLSTMAVVLINIFKKS